MKVSDLDYVLPNELLAREPIEELGKNRSDSRLIVFDRVSQSIEHRHFAEIVDYMHEGDALVLNKSKTIKADLVGWYDNKRRLNIHLAGVLGNGNWQVYSWTKDLEQGKKISFGDGQLTGTLLNNINSKEIWEVRFDQPNILELLDSVARPIMSPYVKKEYGIDKYQNEYASVQGSTELPAAGRHFTMDLLKDIEQHGIIVEYVTLHTGLSSIEVSESLFEEHIMHEEQIEISYSTAEVLNTVHSSGGRIFGVGTTVMRTLETAVNLEGKLEAFSGYTDLYIYPGYKFKAVDCFVTNFHGPKTSRIALAAAFTGADLLMRGYREAISHKYRFYEFGDSTLTV